MALVTKEDRKITSDKFTITLPKDWRDGHGLTPKNALTPFYSDGSPLVLIPKGMELDSIEKDLIALIISYRGIKDTRELVETLRETLKGFQ
jgi:bifunctional DNA-binding transcriptional regulator/antitoxin component of YhaV-PrlF toxin-antitoxin module